MKPFEYNCISVTIPQIKLQETFLLFLHSVNVYTAYETRRHGFRFIGSIYYDECLFEFIECLSKINTNNVLKEIKIAKNCRDENLSY